MLTTKYPDSVTLWVDNGHAYQTQSPLLIYGDVRLEAILESTNIRVNLTSDTTPINFVRLRWNYRIPKNGSIMGDAFERTYGQNGWTPIEASRYYPWYFLLSQGNITYGGGVKIRPNAFCFFQVDCFGITLWLDVRNGATGVRLKGRCLDLCRILFRTYDSITPFQAHQQLCAEMSPAPVLPFSRVYGSNNWYYAYGKSSAIEILSAAKFLATLTDGCANRPYMVIDDGWQMNGVSQPGPWIRGNERFPDMQKVSEELQGLDVIPGVWFRPLYNEDCSLPKECKSDR